MINAFATDNYGIDNVELYINGSLIGNLEEEPYSLYSYAWDTYTLENNSEHTINMIAKDIHNNETSAQQYLSAFKMNTKKSLKSSL